MFIIMLVFYIILVLNQMRIRIFSHHKLCIRSQLYHLLKKKKILWNIIATKQIWLILVKYYTSVCNKSMLKLQYLENHLSKFCTVSGGFEVEIIMGTQKRQTRFSGYKKRCMLEFVNKLQNKFIRANCLKIFYNKPLEFFSFCCPSQFDVFGSSSFLSL